MEYQFSISMYDPSAELDEHGFETIRTYDTIRAGAIKVVEAPEGTRRLHDTSSTVEGGPYSRSSVAVYECPDGARFRAGGGGPSDADTIIFLPRANAPS
jgi:hypothetical protein